MKPEQIARYWGKVAVGEEDECWLWTGAKTRGGYGHIKIGPHFLRAPRLALHLAYGLDIHGKWIARHSCDTPACCNPNHLIAGTHAENMLDMVARGRSTRGDRDAESKLSLEQVREIRNRVQVGESSRTVADEFGISYEQVRRIFTRKSWSWVE